MLSLPQLNYVRILETASVKIRQAMLNAQIECGTYFLALGFIGMQDEIVLVDSSGKVVVMPYDSESYEVMD